MQVPVPHHAVCFGEVLLDILPSGPLPGGAPLNVAFHLKKLGLHPAIISKRGTDKHGADLMVFLKNNGISTQYIQTDKEQPTGIVHAVPDEKNEVVYDIVQPVAWDFIEWEEKLSQLVRKVPYFVYGSLAARSKTSRVTLHRLLEESQTRVLDINLRPPHYDKTEVEYLLHKADILKLNLAELDGVCSWPGNYHHSTDKIALIQERYQIPLIIVTKGGDGALVNDNGKVYEQAGYPVNVADTIGSGDAFLAGFLSRLIQEAPIAESLAFASAMGTFIATQRGACPDYQAGQVWELIQVQSSISSSFR